MSARNFEMSVHFFFQLIDQQSTQDCAGLGVKNSVSVLYARLLAHFLNPECSALHVQRAKSVSPNCARGCLYCWINNGIITITVAFLHIHIAFHMTAARAVFAGSVSIVSRMPRGYMPLTCWIWIRHISCRPLQAGQ